MSTNALELEEYQRYGRQMILPEIGLKGQLRLKHASVLVIGAGGLGCPVIAYLAGAGVGRLGVVDSDTIELSNVHRQTLHKPRDGGMYKVESARTFVTDLNDNIAFQTYAQHLTHENAITILKDYSLVLDCCDNQPTRYLISDTCVVLGIPLISGSALKTDGQMAVFNYKGGPCYRCLFPTPSPPQAVQSCGEAGILGPVVGLIGTLQALEAIKLIVQQPIMAGNEVNQCSADNQSRLTLFSAFSTPQWRSVNLRRKKPQCLACGETSTISATSITEGRLDYEQFCSSLATTDDLNDEDHLLDVKAFFSNRKSYNVLDVRDRVHFEIAHLSHATNVPMETVSAYTVEDRTRPIVVVCRIGVDSRTAAKNLRLRYPNLQIWDLKGGLQAYSKVDRKFPLY